MRTHPGADESIGSPASARDGRGRGGGCDRRVRPGRLEGRRPEGRLAERGGVDSWNGEGVVVTARAVRRDCPTCDEIGPVFLACAFNRSRAVAAALRTSSRLS